MKNQITVTGNALSMTHKEIADLVGSRPDNVKVSIERLAEKGVIRLPALQEIEEINNLGLPVLREYYVFKGELGKRDSIVVVAQLSPEFTAQLVDHWQELEKEVSSLRIGAPAPQAISASDHILSVARVVAEATASATMKAVMELSGTQVFAAQALPQASREQVAPVSVAEPVGTPPAPEFSPVIDLMWAFGISDAACRRLASYANLPTKLTNGERGHLLIHHSSFADAVFTLIDESTPPTGKRKRWQHPDFGGFTLKVTEANKAAVEAKQ